MLIKINKLSVERGQVQARTPCVLDTSDFLRVEGHRFYDYTVIYLKKHDEAIFTDIDIDMYYKLVASQEEQAISTALIITK